MAALCAATAIIAVVVPFAAALSLLGTVPMGVLAYRYRLRVLLAATVAGSTIAFLIAGMGGMMTVLNCAYIGGLTGIVKRRGRGTPTVVVAALIAGTAFGAASVAALAGNRGQVNYAAAKGGLQAATRALSLELASRNITVNCVAPGFINTDMTAELSEEQQKALLGQIPLGHLGRPQDIAHAVAFLASPQAGYITGQELHVNGGIAMI